ncbi:ATP-binding protein [Leucothrix sargassi]|nr:ATP-binding protein [Leucothrix sargassi]
MLTFYTNKKGWFMPKTPTTPSKDFSETLDELIAFKDYFTDNDKNKVLAEWIHEETGINKASVRIALKYVAPFVIARLANAGKIVGQAWMAKLHDRLGEKEWYLNFTQNLLNTLKTKTDKSLGTAFEIPSKENIGALVSNPARWENLKPEQQGLVQLLHCQNAQTEMIDGLQQQQELATNQLDSIINFLTFDLDLKTPEFLVNEAEKALEQQEQKSSAVWLTYTSRQADLIGREHSLKLLNDFFDADKNFSWLVITGDGGTGKSRLALDALLSRQSYCDVGFLNSDKLDKSDDLNKWRPARPTIITIDYAAEYPTQIANWIDHFIKHQDDYDFPVRLLILERVAKQQSWWDGLVSASSSAYTRQRYLYTSEPHELLPLKRSEQQQALQSFLESLDCDETLPEQESDFWNVLDTLSNNGRPLFIGMVASAIEHHSIHHIRDWNQNKLLEHVLKREEARWEVLLSQYSESEKTAIYKLLTIATLSGGFDLEKDEDRIFDILESDDIANNENELERYIDVIQQLSTNGSGTLQPDIFAEYFLLQESKYKTGRFTRSLKKSLVTAHKISSQNTLAFISRTAIDYVKGFERSANGEYIEDITAFKWWKNLFTNAKDSGNCEQLEKLTTAAFNTIQKLSLHAHWHTILDNWLPELTLIEASETKALTLIWKGRIYGNLGKYDLALEYYQNSNTINKQLGYKHNEGTTLNNISQIYHGRGDYETALIYLQQALVIRQKIGDKSGVATTLNNISSIYQVRGDYDMALTYLKQTLSIDKEIGDKHGEGTTLSNIAQVFKIRGNYKKALAYLEQTLKIDKETGDKSGEGITLGNIASIFISRADYETALTYLQQSLDIQQKVDDSANESTTLNNISQIYYGRGDYETALIYLQQALDIQKDIGDKFGQGTTLNNISKIYYHRGNPETALTYLRQSLDIQQEIGDKSGESTTLNTISQIYHDRDDYETALIYLQQALDIQKDIGDKFGQGTTLNNISQIYYDRGNPETAFTYLRQSLDIQQEIGDVAGLCVTTINIGHLQWQNKQNKEALKSLARAYKIAKKIGHAQALEVLTSMAEQLKFPEGVEGWEIYLENEE